MILNRSIFHHTLVPLIALTILMVPSIRVLAEQSAAEKVYSGETFENVLKDLSSLSGYQIEVPEDLLSIKVYGNFSVDEVDHFLSRVLRDYNHSFYVNETQNTMIVRVFGEKLGDSVLVVGETGGKKIDIFTGLPKEEVARMHEERRQRLAEPGVSAQQTPSFFIPPPMLCCAELFQGGAYGAEQAIRQRCKTQLLG
jgi:hypothetical protein